MILSCKHKSLDSRPSEIKTTASTTQPETRMDALPAPNEDFIDKLKTETQGIDYMFRNTNFSISQSDAGSIATTIAIMGTEKSAFMDKKCNSPIRITYVGGEGIICDTEMYIEPSCMYQVYLIDNKPTYSARVTQAAFTYLNNLIKQAVNVQQR